jgi:NADH dehydrogenase FAD-containing subunit
LNKEKHKTIDIIGTGPVGFEIAMCLNKKHKINLHDILTKDKIFSYVNEYNKNFLLNLLDKKNINLYLGKFYNQNDYFNKDNYKIFCVGTKPNDLTSNLKINDKLELLSAENKNIFMGGDCVGLQNNPLYIKNAQVAYQQGVYLANKLNRKIDENEQFKYISNGIALNIDDEQVLIEKHNIIPAGIYPDFIVKLYSVFCI